MKSPFITLAHGAIGIVGSTFEGTGSFSGQYSADRKFLHAEQRTFAGF